MISHGNPCLHQNRAQAAKAVLGPGRGTRTDVETRDTVLGSSEAGTEIAQPRTGRHGWDTPKKIKKVQLRWDMNEIE